MGEAHANVMAVCAEYHKQYRRYIYVTPKSYISFLEGYCKLYTEKLIETRELAGSITSGLQKMNDAKEDVNRLKVMKMYCPMNIIDCLKETSVDVLKPIHSGHHCE